MVTVILTYCIGEENIFFIKIFSGDTEQQLQKLAHEALQRGDTRDLVARLAEVTTVMILMILMMMEMITVIMVQMLLEDKRRDEVGLLVDWLELLDPTIISSCPELQMKLVFGKSKVCLHD